jgi:hypothetical protein
MKHGYTGLEPVDNVLDVTRAWEDSGTGTQDVLMNIHGQSEIVRFALQEADEDGDGTVPMRSGKAPEGQAGVRMCVALSCPTVHTTFPVSFPLIFSTFTLTNSR